jgi:hypothetical protein
MEATQAAPAGSRPRSELQGHGLAPAVPVGRLAGVCPIECRRFATHRDACSTVPSTTDTTLHFALPHHGLIEPSALIRQNYVAHHPHRFNRKLKKMALKGVQLINDALDLPV